MAKFNKGMLFILAVLCLLVVIPSTFASDINDNATLADNDVPDMNSIYVDSNVDDGGDGSQDAPYNSISKAIENYDSSANSNIYVKNGTYEIDNRVTVNKDVTIIGENSQAVIFDGKNVSALFEVTSNNVRFKGVSFVNGLGSSGWSGYAAAIDASGRNLFIDDCTFENNHARAIAFNAGGSEWNAAYLQISNSRFISNVNDGWGASGGAIYTGGIYSSINVTNCVFFNNTATNGGAISIGNGRKESYISNCDFISNVAGEGSAIYFSNAYDTTIKNCNFENNIADNDSGVIDFTGSFNQRKLSVGKNTFVGNTPSTEYNVDGNIEIVQLDNNDKLSGEDIATMDVGDDVSFAVTLTDSSNNPISGKRIIINLTDYFGKTTSYNAITNAEGQAIISLANQSAGTYSVVSTFKGDATWDEVSALNTIKIRAEHSNNIAFNESIVKVKAGESHLVLATTCDEYMRPVVFFDSVTITWKTHSGGTRIKTNVGISGSNFVVDVLDFELTTQSEYYYINFTASSSIEAVAYGTLIVDTSIPLPPVDENIDIIYVDQKIGSDELGDGSEANPLATIQTALYLNEIFGGNKTIFVKEGIYNISNYEVYGDVNVIGEKGKTILRQHTGDIGMLYLDNGAVTRFTNVTFMDGDAGTYSLYNAVIVVRYSGAVAYFDGCEFYNNKASSDGMIYVAHQAAAYFNNCIFANNIARTFNPAGAVHVQDAYLSVNNSYFYNNTASEGGAIFVGGDSIAFIENSMFYKNNALNDTAALSGGGAIYINNWNTHIYNCSFIENYAEVNGGAIYILIGEVDIQKSVFINNRVKKSGSGIGTAIACDSGYTVKLYVDHSILYSDSYGNLVHIMQDYDMMNEVILNDNYWGSNSKVGSNYNTYVIIEASADKDEIKEGELVEITVQFKGNSGPLAGSVHDYALNITSILGRCDADSITIVDNVAKFNYVASSAGEETITFTNNGVRYQFKFNVAESGSKADVNANISVNANRTVVSAELPIDLAGNVTFVVDGVEYSVAPNNGVADCPIDLMPGNHEVYMIYAGDDNYRATITDKFNFTIDKLDSDLEVYVGPVVVGEDIIVEVTANSKLNGNVIISVNNKNYTVKVTNGAGSKQIEYLEDGTYTVTAVFRENEYFLGGQDSFEFNVVPVDIDVIYVSQARGSESGNGSFDNPYLTLDSALERNRRLGGNKTIIVEEGSYVLNRYAVTKDVTIKADGEVVIAPSTNTNHIYIGGNVRVTLEGLTFMNGNGIDAGVIDMGSDEAGNIGKELIIINCSFINNRGAVGAISTYANTTIISSAFINNTATGKTGYNQGIISIQDNAADLKYNIFLNNKYESDIIVSRVAGLANDNFWGDNNRPSDVSAMLNINTWAVVVPSIDGDVRTKTNYDLAVEFKQTSDGVNFNGLSGYLPNMTFNLDANNGMITPSDVVVSKNIGVVNYNVSLKGFEEISVDLYGNTVAELSFYADVPEYDKIYVSTTGNDLTGDGSVLNPFASIAKAISQNRATGGDKTIIINPGTYTEHGLVIDSDVVIIGENAVIDASNEDFIFEISANVNITSVSLINAKTAITHKSGELNINDSEFKNNQRAVLSDAKLNVANSRFSENTVVVLEVNGETFIENCVFESNDVDDVVKITNKTTIINSTFTNGGAIHTGGSEVAIKDSEFKGNGIAIIASDNVEISNNNFNGDSISLYSANAILAGNRNATINIENSNISGSIVTFLNGATVIAASGTVQLNATVTDDMGNIINGGTIIFEENGAVLGEAEVKNGIASLNATFVKGNHTITGSFDSDVNAVINSALLRIDVDYYWFIGDVGYESLKEAIDAANIGDVIKGVPGTYTIPKLAIGHRYFSLEPWEVIKSVTITSLTDEAVTLEGDNNQMFFVDIGSELTLKNVILSNGGRDGDDGGAIEAMYGTNLTVINCTFTDNHAESGGAIYSLGGVVVIRDCVFDNNFAYVGGAVDVIGHYDELVSIENCKFTNNYAFYGGAVYNGGGNIEIDQSLFYNNAANVGGALMMRDGDITVTGTDFISNTASYDGKNSTSLGGAVHNYLGNLYFTNVKFIDNHADKGGALELENGLYMDISWTTFDNCTFANNTAKMGGALYLGDSFDPYVNITDSRFESNEAINGSVMIDNCGHVTITNTEFVKNTGSDLIVVTGEFISGEGFSPDQTFYSELIVINSRFNDNDVMNDIITNEWSIVRISESQFDGENTIIINNGKLTANDNRATNTKNYVVINNAELSLNLNEFDTPILNKKDILTPTSVVILDNETKFAAIGQDYEVYAVVCDDNENIIEYGSLEFLINGEAIPAKYADNAFRLNFTVVGGTTVIDARFDGAGLKDMLILKGGVMGKLPAELNVIVNNITVGQTASITVSVNPRATGNVTVKINGVTYEDAVKNGMVSFQIPDLACGNYTVEIDYAGDVNYAPAKRTVDLEVSKVENYDFTIDISKKDLNTAEIEITLPDDATGNVSIIVNGKEYNATVENGKIHVTADNIVIGPNDINITYSGDEKYASINRSEIFNGDKKESFVQISTGNIKLGQDAVIIISVPEDATGNVLITVNDRDYLRSVNNGRVILTISNLIVGEYGISADYLGDANYLDSYNTSSFKVIDSVVDSVIMITIDASGKITGDLRGIDGSIIRNALITYTIEGMGQFSIITDENGRFAIPGIEHREYVFRYSGNDEYSSSIAAITIEGGLGNRQDVDIVVNPKYSAVAVDVAAGEKGKTVYATLKDANGNALANKTVQVIADGSVYDAVSDSQGRIAFNLKFSAAKTYTYALSFAGDSQYNPSKMVSFKVTVSKKKTTISAKAKKFKANKKVKKYKVTLKTVKSKVDGKTYLKAGKKLILKIKGKTFTAKTNKKGVATFKIKKLTKKGKYTATIKFKGDNTYKASTKKVKITIK